MAETVIGYRCRTMSIASLRRNDTLLLCSDGLYSVVSKEEMVSILQSTNSLQQKVARLLESARAGGAPDNVSCILLRYDRDPQLPER